MIILCDVDGVLADFVGHLHRECGVKSKVHEWDLKSCLTKEEMDRVATKASQPGFCRSIDWYTGAKLFLYQLMNVGTVFAVTAPWSSETWDAERRTWLKNHLEPWRVLSCAGKAKSLVRGDVLIEDHPGTAADWLRSNPDGYAILMDRSWNREDSRTYQEASVGECAYRMLRAGSYEEALGLVEGVKIAFGTRREGIV